MALNPQLITEIEETLLLYANPVNWKQKDDTWVWAPPVSVGLGPFGRASRVLARLLEAVTAEKIQEVKGED